MPQRIQRQRTKGWRMPEGAIYVGRPTRWGNPFRLEHLQQAVGRNSKHIQLRRIAVDMYRDHLIRHDYIGAYLFTLRGHDLVCWCPLDQPCHADVLLELANA